MAAGVKKIMLIKKNDIKLFLNTCIVICFLLSAINSSAQIQQVKFNLITGTNGVSVGKITGITRDKYGFMWFADQSNHCLIKFDGSHMMRYHNVPNNPNSLGGYNLECLAVDSSGNIWIGFYGMGLDKFDPVTGIFTHFRHDSTNNASLSHDFVSAVMIDHLGNVWVGTNGGLDILDQKSGTFKHYSHTGNDSKSLSHNAVRAIYEDRDGELWVGTGNFFDRNKEGGLNRFHRQSGNFTRYLSDPANPQTLIDNRVRSIFEDSQGTFWIGTNGDGLHTMDRKTGLFTRLRYNPQQPEQLSRPPLQGELDHITFITEDADKKIWIGTWTNGLTLYDPRSGQMTRYGNKDDKTGALTDNTSWCAYATPDGFLWLGTELVNASLYKIDLYNMIIPHFGNNNTDGVISFNEESASVCWYGTVNGLVRKDFKNGTTRRFVNNPGDPNSLSNNRVTEIIKDKQGNFWIGTGNGLNHFNLKTEKFTRYFNVPDKNIPYYIWSLCEDSESTIWIGTVDQGLQLLNKKTGKFTNYKEDPADITSINNNAISDIYKDEADDIWIGTFNAGGLHKLNRQTGKFTRYLPGMGIHCIYRDAAGVLWVGGGGLFSYDKKSDSFNSITDENSENYNGVAGIVADKEDNLWISTLKGILMVNKKRDLSILYGKENMVPGANFEFYGGSSFSRQDGELNFGSKDGYYAFYPEKLKTTSGNTPLYFTKFRLGNKEIKPGKGRPLKESLFSTKEIRLDHNQNVFSISATFIDFRNNGDKNFYYQLENYDTEWRAAGAEDKLQYFKVPPGKYIFRIKKANNSNGEWIEKSIAIVISPPWWATWWFRILVSLALIATIYVIIRWRLHQKFQSQLETSQKEKQLAELHQQKSELEMQALRAQMNPHFIFNCLSSINRFILKNEPDTASDYLTKFSRLIRMVLNNSRKAAILLEDELEMLHLYLDLERLRFKNAFDYSIAFYNNFDAASVLIPPLLLQPFAENAIWHGLMHKTGKGHLEIAFALDDSTLNCFIMDDGVGRKNAEALKSKSAERQKSMGMQITAQRIALLNRNMKQTFFEIEDLVNKNGDATGTKVTLKIRYMESMKEFSDHT